MSLQEVWKMMPQTAHNKIQVVNRYKSGDKRYFRLKLPTHDGRFVDADLAIRAGEQPVLIVKNATVHVTAPRERDGQLVSTTDSSVLACCFQHFTGVHMTPRIYKLLKEQGLLNSTNDETPNINNLVTEVLMRGSFPFAGIPDPHWEWNFTPEIAGFPESSMGNAIVDYRLVRKEEAGVTSKGEAGAALAMANFYVPDEEFEEAVSDLPDTPPGIRDAFSKGFGYTLFLRETAESVAGEGVPTDFYTVFHLSKAVPEGDMPPAGAHMLTRGNIWFKDGRLTMDSAYNKKGSASFTWVEDAALAVAKTLSKYVNVEHIVVEGGFRLD